MTKGEHKAIIICSLLFLWLYPLWKYVWPIDLIASIREILVGTISMISIGTYLRRRRLEKEESS